MLITEFYRQEIAKLDKQIQAAEANKDFKLAVKLADKKVKLQGDMAAWEKETSYRNTMESRQVIGKARS